MATSIPSGVHFDVEEDSVVLFGASGERLAGGSWAISHVRVVGSDSMQGRIRQCIENDVKAGNGAKIAQLQLNARHQAVVFFLEGGLTRADFDRAVEGLDYIDIPDVEVQGLILTVRILPDLPSGVATADADGNIL